MSKEIRMKFVRLLSTILLYVVVQTGFIMVQQLPFDSTMVDRGITTVLAAPIVGIEEPPTPNWEFENPMVMVLDVEIETYMYRLDEYGHAIWKRTGIIPAGVMIKLVGGCPDGFTQVEYPNPAGGWKVEYMKCE